MLLKIALFLCSVISSTVYANIFRADQHCVAWKAQKTSFFFSKSHPIGMNCEISVDLKQKGELYQIKLVAPLSAFDSDNSQRDQDVSEMLLSADFPNVEFESTAAPKELWGQILELGRGIITGKLTLAGKSIDVDCPISVSRSGDVIVLSGVLNTHLTSLNIEPPSVLLGAVARVDDAIEFHYRIRLDKVKSGNILSQLILDSK